MSEPIPDVEYVGTFAPFGHPDHVGPAAIRYQLVDEASRPPLYHHGGLKLLDADTGTSHFELPVGARWRTEDGAVPAAASIYLCDAPLGTAVLSDLPAGFASPTAELSVFHLAPPTGSLLHAEARLVWRDDHTGYSECTITDEHGTLVSRSTTRIAISRVPAGATPPGPRPIPEGFVPHHARPVPEGAVVPYLDLHGVEVLSTRTGDAILRLETTGWHLSPSANLYGGTLGLFAQAALDEAAATTAPEGAVTRPLDIKVQYPRPIGPGKMLTADARVVHAGRRVCFTEVLIHRDDGKLVTLGTGTHGYES